MNAYLKEFVKKTLEYDKFYKEFNVWAARSYKTGKISKEDLKEMLREVYLDSRENEEELTNERYEFDGLMKSLLEDIYDEEG